MHFIDYRRIAAGELPKKLILPGGKTGLNRYHEMDIRRYFNSLY